MKRLERESVMSSMNLADLEDYIRFDTRLKHKFLTRTTQEAEEAAKFHEKWVDPLTNLALLVYFVVVPLFSTPEWCSVGYSNWSKFNDNKNFRLEFFYDCQWVSNAKGLDLEMSGFPSISPLYAELLNITCLLILCWCRWHNQKWMRVSRANQRRTYVLYVVAAVCISLDLWSIYTQTTTYIPNFLKPVIVIAFSSTISGTLSQVVGNMKDALAVIVTIFTFIGFFSVIGFFIWRGRLEGYQNFSTMGSTYYQMTILLTTSNFPDIMLPALKKSTMAFFFFWLFLTMGLYLLLNMLLATIFSGYKRRITERALRTTEKRTIYIEKFYNLNDSDNKGYLSHTESKRFFEQVLDLDYTKKEDQLVFKKVMKVLDPDMKLRVYKDTLMEWFETPNFLD